ncbi:succinylglutamate desuccinylase/aspartoacylase family protein [Candidatus Nomurabacteria bacterium]|nr:succinylglutamate desuccinylase/aspartoacylase family protein [Candidatus Nomurabacteria bacterium]
MKVKQIKIDKKNKIPVYLFGTEPKILLMAGVHGDEKTGVVILKKIIKQLQNSKKSYPVAIIPCVNMRAYRDSSRINPKDKIDFNRIFPVIKIKSESYQIGKAIQDFAEKFTMVIDIHVFTGQHTLMCGVDLNISKGKIQKNIKDIMSQIGMEAICRIDHASEPKKDGSLCAYLQHKKVLAFGIELPPSEVLTKNNFDTIKNNLIDLIKGFQKRTKMQKLKSYIRLPVLSEYTGFFSPNKIPGLEVKKYDTIGNITEKNQQKHNINSPFNGRLISVSYKKSVKNGDKLFVIGKKVKG